MMNFSLTYLGTKSIYRIMNAPACGMSKSGIFLELCNKKIDKGVQREIREVIKAVGVRWLCFPEGVPPTLESLRLGELPSLEDLTFLQSLSITFLMDFINHI
jgi:hypothetical protein